jgi:hypothetical protein
MRWVACRPSFMLNETWKTLVLNCRRNGEAYELTFFTAVAQLILKKKHDFDSPCLEYQQS